MEIPALPFNPAEFAGRFARVVCLAEGQGGSPIHDRSPAGILVKLRYSNWNLQV